ncbi:MAG: HAD-IA family hydrolase [Candidatus Rokubacteria bacterium]|nr:HAD-IA family hydrolase [Candidatus Rokubacteria bacterium]MBI4594140.1 HAD-IA family hydrolase [Candidatus Rokubacteria bacterium]
MVSQLRPVPRAIFFDAGNTLLRMNYPVIAAELQRHGVRVDAGDVAGAEWRARVRLDEEVLARRGPGRSTEGRGTAGRYLGFLLDELGVGDEAVIQAVAEWRRAYNPPVGLWNTPDPDARAALGLVRDAGLAAGVISNSNGSVRSILEQLGLAPYLAFVLDSAEVGVEKPDPRIFRLGLEQAGIEPAQAVYIGDLYSVDVLGARAVGMDAVLLDPGGCWGARDCPVAPDLVSAVRLVLPGQSGRVTKG